MSNYRKQMNTYWSSKETRSAQAKKHTEYMDNKYSVSIAKAIAETSLYSDISGSLFNNLPLRSNHPVFILNGLDSVTAAIKYHIPRTRTCILNFASYKNPGGKFIDGSAAQEESLCHSSFLYNVLSKKMNYYEFNRNHLNKALYTNRALYIHDVVFEQLVYKNDSDMDVMVHKFDVLTCAAPNAKAFFTYNMQTSENIQLNEETLYDRMKFIINIMEANNVTTAILGAFGCGVFAQDPYRVASYWRELTNNTNNIKTIVHPVLGEDTYNYKQFKKVFG